MGVSAVGCCQHPGTRVLTGREERRGGAEPGGVRPHAEGRPGRGDPPLEPRQGARPATPGFRTSAAGAGGERDPLPQPLRCCRRWGSPGVRVRPAGRLCPSLGAALTPGGRLWTGKGLPRAGEGGGEAHGPVASFCAFPAGPALTGGQCRPGREETGSGRAGRPGERKGGPALCGAPGVCGVRERWPERTPRLRPLPALGAPPR